MESRQRGALADPHVFDLSMPRSSGLFQTSTQTKFELLMGHFSCFFNRQVSTSQLASIPLRCVPLNVRVSRRPPTDMQSPC